MEKLWKESVTLQFRIIPVSRRGPRWRSGQETTLQTGRSRIRFPMVWHNPSGRTMALGSTQPLTEMSTRCISWGKDGPYHHPMSFPWNLGTLTSWNPLYHSRPVAGLLYLYQCNGTVLPLPVSRHLLQRVKKTCTFMKISDLWVEIWMRDISKITLKRLLSHLRATSELIKWIYIKVKVKITP